MDTSDPQIIFDKSGVCNHCAKFDCNVNKIIRNNKKGEKELEKIVNNMIVFLDWVEELTAHF